MFTNTAISKLKYSRDKLIITCLHAINKCFYFDLSAFYIGTSSNYVNDVMLLVI